MACAPIYCHSALPRPDRDARDAQSTMPSQEDDLLRVPSEPTTIPQRSSAEFLSHLDLDYFDSAHHQLYRQMKVNRTSLTHPPWRREVADVGLSRPMRSGRISGSAVTETTSSRTFKRTAPFDPPSPSGRLRSAPSPTR